MSGADTLPELRSAMRAADQVTGEATAHVHPRIEAAALAPLLSAAGFAEPVVDIDRVRVAYASLNRLVADLRGMGTTNVLAARSRRPVTAPGPRKSSRFCTSPHGVPPRDKAETALSTFGGRVINQASRKCSNVDVDQRRVA
jgi:hypothetical protein